ncbi:hypothetical protein [Kribbella sp. NPDC051718]|uniref:hypothetical protein n=1 Tax=Kribbella sp. NPDC051718 TaxID=3155168 RepID=UPI003432E224
MHLGEVERVYIESDRYDGPWAGVADVGGVAHYFQALEGLDMDRRVFQVWPIVGETLALEQEQWAIYVRWNDRHEAGEEPLATHPGHGGVDSRYDELEQLLEPLRQPPDDTLLLRAETVWLEPKPPRYYLDGVDYGIRWRAAGVLPA